MDNLNTIFENYGGLQMERIFKSYLILALIIKQFLVSIFMTPADPSAEVDRENDNQIYNEFTKDCQDQPVDEFHIMQQVLNLLKPESEKYLQYRNPTNNSESHHEII